MSYLDVPCAQLYYEVDGAGPAVLLVHAGVAHLRMWDEQVAAWKDRFTVIRYDQRGFGKTTCDDRPFSNRDTSGFSLTIFVSSARRSSGCRVAARSRQTSPSSTRIE